MRNTKTMPFDNGRNRVRIPKSTLVALGSPRHITDIPDEAYATGEYCEYQN